MSGNHRGIAHDRFEAWMRDHIAILYRVANAFAWGADRHDLMQELMLAVFQAAPDFRGEAKVSTFLYRVSHNRAMTWKLARTFSAPGPAGGERDRLDRVYEAIRALPPLDRSLLLLSLDGLSYQEIVAIHGLTETNVGARLSRLRSRLARDLKETLS
jgi:DNA-directed RNA polymerase specialized sigma24 family protein